MNHSRPQELDDLKVKIHSFRVSDLQSLVASFGRSRNGKKQELQNRALEILRTHPSDIDMLAFKRKIHELYRIAQDEAKQTHYDFQPQRPISQPTAIVHPFMAPGPYTLPPQTRPGTNAIIYQNGGIVSGNGYPNATVYPTRLSAPTIHPPPTIASNLGDTVRIISPPISYSNVTFKPLPFYRHKHEILKPTILKLKTNGRNNTTQMFQISFVLTCQIASDIAMSRDWTKNDFVVQAQLRVCAIDSSNNATLEYDDLLPLGLYVRMNDKQCPLPPCSPCSRPNVEARRVPLPINVTQFLKLSPMNVNKLTINWTPEVGRTFVACLNVVEKLSSSYLMEKLKEKPSIAVDITKQIIAKQYKRVIDDDDENDDADDDDIATTIVRVSLQCPLAKFRMMYPARGRNCSHLQCFDGFAYISCNEKKSVWMCPVCNRSLFYDDLLIDQYFVEVLASEESIDCQEVQLFVDGSWKVYDEEEDSDGNDKQKQKNSLTNSPSENLSLSSSEEYSHTNDQKNVLSDNAVSTSGISAAVPDSFVDLTEDDEGIEAEAQAVADEEQPSSTSVKDNADGANPSTHVETEDVVMERLSESVQQIQSSSSSSSFEPSPSSHPPCSVGSPSATSEPSQQTQPTAPNSPRSLVSLSVSPNPVQKIQTSMSNSSAFVSPLHESMPNQPSDVTAREDDYRSNVNTSSCEEVSSPVCEANATKNPMILSPSPSPPSSPNSMISQSPPAEGKTRDVEMFECTPIHDASEDALENEINSDVNMDATFDTTIALEPDEDIHNMMENSRRLSNSPLQNVSRLSTPERENSNSSVAPLISTFGSIMSPPSSESTVENPQDSTNFAR